MNPNLERLQPYPFEKLNQLLVGITPPATFSPIVLSIGEPKHPCPEFIKAALTANLQGLSNYPLTAGSDSLRTAIANWLQQRFKLKANLIDPQRHILPVNGTREGLFAVAQCILGQPSKPLVIIPNPFYQIYEGAVLMAGCEPWFLNVTDKTNMLPDLDLVPNDVWQQCGMIYLCSPGNPTGAVVPQSAIKNLFHLADKFDFVIVADECYSELYFDETSPPIGLLQAAAALGRTDFNRCLVFHSLSKRSSVPGMRSGFVAGDDKLIKEFKLYRTYHGSAMSPPVQAASTASWQDEEHVKQNRNLYRQKFQSVAAILSKAMPVTIPEGGFYLWLKTPADDTTFARELFAQKNVTVLPGSFLSRPAHGINPGAGYVRIALVAPIDECIDAANRIVDFMGKQ